MGDEIINVCGKRLRGLLIDDAIKALKQPKRELDIVVARETDNIESADAFATFFEEDHRLRDEHLRVSHKMMMHERNYHHDYHETCSEVNLSSRPSKNGEHSFFSLVSQRHLLVLFVFSLPPLKAFVTRTYIGGGAGNSQSSLAMKIHRKSCASSKSQLSLFPNSGSLSSLHETALTSDVEDVRSSVSAYQPISHRKSSKRYYIN